MRLQLLLYSTLSLDDRNCTHILWLCCILHCKLYYFHKILSKALKLLTRSNNLTTGGNRHIFDIKNTVASLHHNLALFVLLLSHHLALEFYPKHTLLLTYQPSFLLACQYLFLIFTPTHGTYCRHNALCNVLPSSSFDCHHEALSTCLLFIWSSSITFSHLSQNVLPLALCAIFYQVVS